MGHVPLIKLSYRSVPPVSTTSTMSSRTDRISFPLLVLSKRNSAKFGDIIIMCRFTKGVWGATSKPQLVQEVRLKEFSTVCI